MPTSENSKPTNSEVFTCPSNKGVEIIGSCPVHVCPYHSSRLNGLFSITVPTLCGLHEPELQGAPTLATLQKSEVKKVSATTLRTTYNQAMELIKSKLRLVNDIPDNGYCDKCGRYHSSEEYESSSCKSDRKWSALVLDYYGLLPNAFRRAILWKLLDENSLFIPKKLLERK